MASMEAKTGVKLDTGISGGTFVPEEDTGSVLGFDATGGTGPKKTAESIVPEAGGTGAPEVEQPMSGFNLSWPDLSGCGGVPSPLTVPEVVEKSTEVTEADDDKVDEDETIYIKLQIGANAGQVMSIYFNNMEAESIGITGERGGLLSTESGVVVKLSDSAEGVVTNGMDHAVVGYAIDVTDAENASAAIEGYSQVINNLKLSCSC